MREIISKTILGPNNGINIYRGCSHGCIYCDSRSIVYQVGDFENIAVKKDCVRIFNEQLQRKRKPIMITTGSMCDPYLHIEKKLELTRQILELIYQYGCGVSILTKSDLVMRDLDLICQINKRYKAVVCLTITTIDDELCCKVEPNVCVSSRRFEVLKAFADKGVTTGIWICPILPFIEDTPENIVGIVKKAAEVGIKFFIYFGFGTTMREGSREYFYEQLDLTFPGIKEKYIKQFGNIYSCSSPRQTELEKIFIKECEKYGIIYKPHEAFALIRKEEKNEQLTLF